MTTIAVLPLIACAVAGCDSCPPSLPVKLGNGSVITAPADSGLPSQAGSQWAFYAANPLSPLSVLGSVVPSLTGELPGFLFRVEFSANGGVPRLFDNQVLAPQKLGSIILLDAIVHQAADPSLSYLAESYGAESGNSIGLVSCNVLYVGPISIVTAHVEFSGTISSGLLGLNPRADGTLRFISEVNPLFAGAISNGAKSESVEIAGFALREN